MDSGSPDARSMHPWNHKGRSARDFLWGPIYPLLENKRVESVLNIGGGHSGEWIEMVERHDLRLHVVDEYEGRGSPCDNLQLLQEAISTLHLNERITYEKADALRCDYGKGQYDLVYARYSLHHIIAHDERSEERFVSFFSKLRDALRAGGYFYIREIGRRNFLKHLGPLRPRVLRQIDYRSKTNMEECVDYLERTGFRIVKAAFHVPYPLRIMRPLLANSLANPFLTSAYMLLARRI